VRKAHVNELPRPNLAYELHDWLSTGGRPR
jgi:hypothetical protein